MSQYFYNLLVALDQMCNAILGGDMDVCISSRLALNYPDSWMTQFVDWVFFMCFGQKYHCQYSLGYEMYKEFNSEAYFR